MQPTDNNSNPNPQQTIAPKEKPKLTDDEAQAILAINSLQTKEQTKASNSFLYLVIASIVILVGLSLFIGSRNHPKTTNSSHTPTTVNSTSNPFQGSNSAGSINSEVKYCSNPINAQLTC